MCLVLYLIFSRRCSMCTDFYVVSGPNGDEEAVCSGPADINRNAMPNIPGFPNMNQPGFTTVNQPGFTNVNQPGFTTIDQPGMPNPNQPNNPGIPNVDVNQPTIPQGGQSFPVYYPIGQGTPITTNMVNPYLPNPYVINPLNVGGPNLVNPGYNGRSFRRLDGTLEGCESSPIICPNPIPPPCRTVDGRTASIRLVL